MAKHLTYPEISWWTFYKKVRRLVREGYLVERIGHGLNFDVIQLGKKGFDFIKHDLGELKEFRFNAQSVTHDYWATAFQLAPFLQDENKAVRFYTEQYVQSTDESLFPLWMSKSKEHIPDGFTTLEIDGVSKNIAIEVDLTVKPLIRYDRAAYYFDSSNSKIDLVFWLCGGTNVAQVIFNCLKNANLRKFEIHHFFLTEDFKKFGCNCVARSGQFKGKTLSEIYVANGYQMPGKALVNAWLNLSSEILFPTRKIPMNQRSSVRRGHAVQT